MWCGGIFKTEMKKVLGRNPRTDIESGHFYIIKILLCSSGLLIAINQSGVVSTVAVEVFKGNVSTRVAPKPNSLNAFASFLVSHRFAVDTAQFFVNQVESSKVVVTSRVVEFGFRKCVAVAVV